MKALISTIFVCLIFSFSNINCKKIKSTTSPCTGKVMKTVRPDGSTTYTKLSCTGVCPDKTKCKWLKTTNQHGGTREWCGCGEKEPDNECYLVFVTPGEGEGGGDPHPICPPKNCPKGKKCQLHEELRASGDLGKTYEVTCKCK